MPPQKPMDLSAGLVDAPQSMDLSAGLVDAPISQPATMQQVQQRGQAGQDAFAKLPDSYQGGFADTLQREIPEVGKGIVNTFSGLWDAMHSPVTDEERQALGPNPDPRAVFGHRMLNPIAHAAKWYTDAARGKIPDPVGQALSVAPEAMGQAGGTVIGGKMISTASDIAEGAPAKTSIASINPKPTLKSPYAGPGMFRTPEPPTPAQHMTAAMGTLKGAIPLENTAETLRRVAANAGRGPEAFQGAGGLDAFGKTVQEAIDENQAARAQMIEPIAHERVPLPAGSAVAEYWQNKFGHTTPTVGELDAEYPNITQLERSYKEFNAPSGEAPPLRGGALEARQVGMQARKLHYDYVESRTNGDLTGLQKEASDLLKVRAEFEPDIMNSKPGVRGNIMGSEAAFKSPPKTSLPEKIGKVVGPILGGKGSMARAGVNAIAGSTSPLENFNSRMAAAFDGAQPGPNPHLANWAPPGTYVVPITTPAPGLPPASSIQQPASPVSPSAQLPSGVSGAPQLRPATSVQAPASNVPPQLQLGTSPATAPFVNPGPVEGEILPPESKSPVPPVIRGALKRGAYAQKGGFEPNQPALKGIELKASSLEKPRHSPESLNVSDPALADIEARVKGRAAEIAKKYPVKKGSLKGGKGGSGSSK